MNPRRRPQRLFEALHQCRRPAARLLHDARGLIPVLDEHCDGQVLGVDLWVTVALR